MVVPVVYIIVQNRTVCTYYIIIWLIIQPILPSAELFLGIPVNKAFLQLQITVFNGYVGYFILGYWLNRYSGKLFKWYQWIWIPALMIIVIKTLQLSTENVAETYWNPLNLIVICYSSSFVLFCKKYFNFIWKPGKLFSKYMLGIYIVHVLVINKILPWIIPYRESNYGAIIAIIQSIIVWLISLAFTILLYQKVPALAKKIM